MTSKDAHRRLAGRIVIATHNPGKLEEMRELLMPFGIDAVSAGELGLPEPAEDGTTFKENARLKACAAATACGLPAFADDSGLAVDALGGEPGIYSARWAGPDKDFQAAMQAVEGRLRQRGSDAPSERKAQFVCALCLAWPDGHVEEFDAEPLIVVHVDHRPRPEAKGWSVPLEARLAAPAGRRLEPRAIAKAEGDVQDPPVADSIPVGPRLRGGVRIRSELDQQVVRPQAKPLHPGALQPPQRLVLGPVELNALGRGQPQNVHEEVARALQIGHRQGHRSRDAGDLRARAWPMTRRARIVLHQLDLHAVGVAHRYTALVGGANGIAERRAAR